MRNLSIFVRKTTRIINNGCGWVLLNSVLNGWVDSKHNILHLAFLAKPPSFLTCTQDSVITRMHVCTMQAIIFWKISTNKPGKMWFTKIRCIPNFAVLSLFFLCSSIIWGNTFAGGKRRNDFFFFFFSYGQTCFSSLQVGAVLWVEFASMLQSWGIKRFKIQRLSSCSGTTTKKKKKKKKHLSHICKVWKRNVTALSSLAILDRRISPPFPRELLPASWPPLCAPTTALNAANSTVFHAAATQQLLSMLGKYHKGIHARWVAPLSLICGSTTTQSRVTRCVILMARPGLRSLGPASEAQRVDLLYRSALPCSFRSDIPNTPAEALWPTSCSLIASIIVSCPSCNVNPRTSLKGQFRFVLSRL